jgi:aspartate kinase
MLVSTGERVSMALLSIAIRARGGDAVSLTGSQSGIITNDRHFDARIIEVRAHRVEDELARGRIVIVAGYQGMSYRREITTLGRGGSDTTAVALAAALSAERCEIYSDVDGVYTADPRSVPDAQHLPELDYATMQAMAESGAKVLNAQAVDWARRTGVVIAARRTADYYGENDQARETRVGASSPSEGRAWAVVGDRRLALCTTASDGRALLEAAAHAELPLRDSWYESGRFVAAFSLLNEPDLGRFRASATERDAGLSVETELGAVSLVGVGVGSEPRLLAEARARLPSAPRFFASSPLRLTAVVPQESVADAERAWHDAFVTR